MEVPIEDVIVLKDTYRDIAAGTASAQDSIEKDVCVTITFPAVSERILRNSSEHYQDYFLGLRIRKP